MYKQREERVALADSDTTAYRYCLDALIATIEDMKISAAVMGRRSALVQIDIGQAERRAAELAHRLFEKFIEVAPEPPKLGRRIARWEALAMWEEVREHSYKESYVELYYMNATFDGVFYFRDGISGEAGPIGAQSVAAALDCVFNNFVLPVRLDGTRIERVV